MDTFWKTTAVMLMAVILWLVMDRQDMGILLSIAAACIASAAAISYLTPVLDLLREIEQLAQLSNGMLDILLRAVGVALTAELAGMVCQDAGNSSMGKSLQMLGSAAILYLSIPIIRSLLTLLRDILGEL